jgi:hypothetical protein
LPKDKNSPNPVTQAEMEINKIGTCCSFISLNLEMSDRIIVLAQLTLLFSRALLRVVLMMSPATKRCKIVGSDLHHAATFVCVSLGKFCLNLNFHIVRATGKKIVFFSTGIMANALALPRPEMPYVHFQM